MEQIKIKLLRIDDRLIHGQVIVGWLPVLLVKALAVGNEKIFQDLMRQEMMKLSIPSSIELIFFSPSSPQQIPYETLLLVSSPRDAWQCLQSGIIPEQINVGGLHARPGKTELLEALHLDDEDREFFTRLVDGGHMPFFQPTPQNNPVNMSDIL
ncbi:MAG: PTS sugar transporter subunit IIB [Candidatus Riflebacteria bacterium]|nr:PTS sugar transporter subunit IIB [Candidatus Riflebacteria bacterium]